MATYKRQRFLLMTLDPVHIGTGGYRLGRVDNSIVREPGTRIPKIPGTSLHGAARSYAAQLYVTPEAAGQSQDKVTDPDNNPICYTFGYIKKKQNGDETVAYSGVVNIFDAQVVFFPVYSMAGPVWVSTLNRIREAGFEAEDKENNKLEDTLDSGSVVLTWERKDALNLGWLMVRVAKEKAVIKAPDKWENDQRWKNAKQIAIVKESLFSHIVNSNLEVRTSVAIDPERGAAVDKALFTYEALPRATFLTAEVVLDDYREAWPLAENAQSQTAKGNVLPGNAKWSGPLDVVKSGIQMIEWLGVGGMGTRGFGRIAIVGEPIEKDYGKDMQPQNTAYEAQP
jgi:CRISPR-associated protein Cmr4